MWRELIYQRTETLKNLTVEKQLLECSEIISIDFSLTKRGPTWYISFLSICYRWYEREFLRWKLNKKLLFFLCVFSYKQKKNIIGICHKGPCHHVITMTTNPHPFYQKTSVRGRYTKCTLIKIDYSWRQVECMLYDAM